MDGLVMWNDFEIWRCLGPKPYKELDKILSRNPQGVIIHRSHRQPVKFTPGVLLGPGLCYSNEQGIWHVEQRISAPDAIAQKLADMLRTL